MMVEPIAFTVFPFSQHKILFTMAKRQHGHPQTETGFTVQTGGYSLQAVCVATQY